MFSASHLLFGVLAALIIGLSKTAIPGGGLLATPLFALVVSGRLIAGTTLPVLLVADLFAVWWFGRRAHHEILRPLIAPVATGFFGGALFYWFIGSGGRVLTVVLGLTILLMVAVQVERLANKRQPVTPSPALTGTVGVVGGFTTFVANAAGPVLNTYFTGLGMQKERMIGTSAWFYFAVNAAKVPVYLLIGIASKGGPFFTADTLLFDAALVPAVLAGVYGGRWLLPRVPQRAFTYIVLVLATIASAKLLLGK